MQSDFEKSLEFKVVSLFPEILFSIQIQFLKYVCFVSVAWSQVFLGGKVSYEFQREEGGVHF